MPKPNRREALITLSAVAAAQACGGPDPAPTGPLSAAEVERLAMLTDVIIPTTDTPGAREVGVATMIAEDAGDNEGLLTDVRAMLAVFQASGFFDRDEAGRTDAMTAMMKGDENEQAAFNGLKSLAVDYYYSTEIGLVDELGYQGATYLADFPGCTHDHLTEAV